MPKKRFKFKPVDPQTTDARVMEFIQARVIAAKIDQLRKAVPKTYVINPEGPTRIYEPYTVLDIRGYGNMKEFMVRSDSSDFSVYVKADEDTLYGTSWTNLSEISQQVDEVAAFEREGKYYVHLEDISFKKSLQIELHGIFTAERILVKYDLYPPRGRRFIDGDGE